MRFSRGEDRKGSRYKGGPLLLASILNLILFFSNIGWKKFGKDCYNNVIEVESTDAPQLNNNYLGGRTIIDNTTLYHSELDSNDKFSNQYAAYINIIPPPLSTQDDDECSIYLAPSGVTDENNKPAGLGIYTTKPIKSGEAIFPRGTGPMIPITDFVANNHGKKPTFASSLFTNRCYGFGIESDHPIEDQRRKNCFKSNTNVGTLTNFHPMLLNILVDNNEKYKDNLLSRYKDPGAGAFTYQLGETWRASLYIEAGEEMYIDYGEDWFFEYKLGDNDMDSPEHKIPRVKDYVGAAKMIKVFIDSFEKRNKTLLWDIAQEELDTFHVWINSDEYPILHRQLINLAIGKNLQSFKDFVKSTDEYEALFPEKNHVQRIARGLALRSNLNDRDVNWIKTNGRCLDNIYPSVSSIPQAGQGAFATRNIPKGQVIVPIPLTLLIPDRKALNLYKHEYTGGKLTSIGDPYSKQLLVNYCFSDERGRSSMLLCGQSTNANLINHCSARLLGKQVGQCNPSKGPNAILRWATSFDPDTSDWLKQDIRTINDRVAQEKRGLTLEVVALRTIQRNEEIMIDYGPSWEEAWKEHVTKWRPPTDTVHTHDDDGSSDTRFVPVSDMNLDKEKYLLTKTDLAAGRTYPHKNVRIGCYVTNTYHPCNILTKSNDGWYTVLIYPFQNANQDALGATQKYTWPFPGNEEKVTKLQSIDIQFFVGPYSSDQYLEGVFRHHIGLPDDMWPEHWRNIKSRKHKIRPMRNIKTTP